MHKQERILAALAAFERGSDVSFATNEYEALEEVRYLLRELGAVVRMLAEREAE